MDIHSMQLKLQSFSEKMTEYISNSLLFWATTGYDNINGGYYEAVDFHGNPITSLHRRFRIHPRNIFAHTAATVKGYGNYIDTAIQATSFIMETCWQKKQGFATLSDNEGNIINDTVVLYDQTFTLLAFAWLYHATQQKEYKYNLMTVWKTINETLSYDKYGFATSNKAKKQSDALLLQNPHMHLFEALLDVYQIMKEEYWLAEATNIYTLFSKFFYDKEHRVVLEYLHKDYSPQHEAIDKIEPGHHFEWVWLLHKYRILLRDTIDTDMIENIYRFAMEHGISKQKIPYEIVQHNGVPVKSTQRMWAQTEQLKAHLAMYEYSKDITYIDFAIQTLETLNTYFCSHDISGVWYDCYDIHGTMVAPNSPSSTLYHLFVCLDEFNTACRTIINI